MKQEKILISSFPRQKSIVEHPDPLAQSELSCSFEIYHGGSQLKYLKGGFFNFVYFAFLTGQEGKMIGGSWLFQKFQFFLVQHFWKQSQKRSENDSSIFGDITKKKHFDFFINISHAKVRKIIRALKFLTRTQKEKTKIVYLTFVKNLSKYGPFLTLSFVSPSKTICFLFIYQDFYSCKWVSEYECHWELTSSTT